MHDPDWLTEEVFVVPEFFSEEECQHFIQMCESHGFEEALVSTEKGQVRNTNLRNNDRIILDDLQLAEELWQRIEEIAPNTVEGYRPTGLNERFRFYRYEPGQMFDWHQDFPFERDNSEQSFWTFMVYLNDNFEGGETSFEDSFSEESFDEFQVVPETGKALFFHHPIHHKGEEVLKGRKYVMRTDVMFTPQRKRRR